eukprot:7446805-Alexandrium_andersonii.AAC.1
MALAGTRASGGGPAGCGERVWCPPGGSENPRTPEATEALAAPTPVPPSAPRGGGVAPPFACVLYTSPSPRD